MTVESILRTIEKEAIGTFSMLDGWFDEDPAVLDYRPGVEAPNAHEILARVAHTCCDLMSQIENKEGMRVSADSQGKRDFDWDRYTLQSQEVMAASDRADITTPAVVASKETVLDDDMRFSLRTQLLKCLEHLDAMPNGEGVHYKISHTEYGIGGVDAYQYLYFLTLHGKRQLDQLRQNKNEYLSLNA